MYDYIGVMRSKIIWVINFIHFNTKISYSVR